MEDAQIARVPIRYDGKDAAEHKIELAALAESLSGVARILSVTGHFVVTLSYAKQYQAQEIRVLVEEPRANCYSVVAVLEWIKEYQLLSGAASATLGALVAWLFGKAAGRRDEMKMLKSALDSAIHELAQGNQVTIDRALATVERIATGLSPAIRQAVAPVGKTCSSMTIAGSAVIDEATAEVIRNTDADEVTPERSWTIVVTELDVETLSAKLRLVDAEDGSRIKAQITDPAANVRPNVYTESLVTGCALSGKGKATLRDGEITKLFISDARHRAG